MSTDATKTPRFCTQSADFARTPRADHFDDAGTSDIAVLTRPTNQILVCPDVFRIASFQQKPGCWPMTGVIYEAHIPPNTAMASEYGVQQSICIGRPVHAFLG
jgi:hypothetical protein